MAFEDGKKVKFADGEVLEVDTIFMCTGYNFSFPFLEKGTLTSYGKKKHSKGIGPLYLRTVHV